MAWSAETDATQLTGVDDSGSYFDETPTLSPGESAHVRVDCNPPASPTDELIVEVFGSLDGTDWDDEPIDVYRVPNDQDPNQVSFIVDRVYQFRVRVRSSGTTDTFTADMSYRTDGVSL